MKLSRVVPGLLSTATLGLASTGYIYTFQSDSSAQGDNHDTIDAVAARLVLAQRAGLEDWHFESLDDDNRLQSIEAVNAYGVQEPLFGKEKRSREIIYLEAESIDASRLPSNTHKIAIVDAPSGRRLFNDLHLQSAGTPSSSDSILNYIAQAISGPSRTFSVPEDKEEFYRRVDKAAQNDHIVTILVVPKSDVPESAWGLYEMPKDSSQGLFRHSKRQALQEEPLSETDSSFPTVESTSTTVSSLAANQSDPLPGIFPLCFTSQGSCESTTRNCTGHGKCFMKYQDPDATDNDEPIECWTCQCTASTSSDGKKTTYWGGSACQKKDISVQFWLFVLITVILAFLVSFAVGSVWSMGDEELPSVIGAGVSGPPRR